MPRRSTLRQQAATGDGETCPIADDSSNLAGGGAASVSGEQLECERCGAKDHSGEQCPHFSHRRDQTGDGAQPSAAEIAKNIADGIMPTVVIKAELVVMSGAGLDCFYNFFVAALAKLGLDGAPKSAAALRKRLGSFLRAAANARRVVIGPSAASSELLAAVLSREGSSIEMLIGQLVGGRGTVEGTGGTIVCAVACVCFGVNFFGYRRCGRPGFYERQELLTQCAGHGAAHGSVHALFSPVSTVL